MLVTRGLGPGPLLSTFGLGTAGIIVIQDPSVLLLPLLPDIMEAEAVFAVSDLIACYDFDTNIAICKTDILNSVIRGLVKEVTEAVIHKELFILDTDTNTTIVTTTLTTAWVDVDANNIIEQLFSSNTLIN